MARLAAVEKGLFYPTEDRHVEQIVRLFKGNEYSSGVFTILDPCCGDGKAISLFSEALQTEWQQRIDGRPRYGSYGREVCKIAIDAWGIELQPALADEAALRLGADRVICEALEYAEPVGDPADLVWLNPPYDSINGHRTEPKFVLMASKFLRRDGMMVIIVPDHVALMPEFVNAMNVSGLRLKAATRYGDGYDVFKQCVIIANKESGQRYGSVERLRAEMDKNGDLSRDFPYPISLSSARSYDKSDTPFGLEVVPEKLRVDEWAKSPLLSNGDMGPFHQLIGQPEYAAAEFRPLMKVGTEHAAMLVASGAVDGLEIEYNGRHVIIRGGSYKVTETVKEKDAQTGVISETEFERLVTSISFLDIDTFDIETINTDDDREKFEEMLKEWAGLFVETVRQKYPPVVSKSVVDDWMPELHRVKAPAALARHDNGLFRPQAVRSAAVLEQWRNHPGVAIDGEPSCGKTVMSAAAAAIQANRREDPRDRNIVVMLPPKKDLLDKWAKELRLALRSFNPTVYKIGTTERVVPKSVKDRHREMMSGMELWARLIQAGRIQWRDENHRKKAVGEILHEIDLWWKKWQESSHSVKTPLLEVDEAFANPGLTIILLKSTTAKLSTSWENVPLKRKRFPGSDYKLLACPICGGLAQDPTDETNYDTNKRKCHSCGEQLWQHVNTRRKDRWPVAEHIHKYKGRYTLIVDECHETKGADTAIGYATNALVYGSRKTLQMTATTYSGKASSIFQMLYRTSRDFRRAWGYNQVGDFVKFYGLISRTTKLVPRETRGHMASGYREIKGSPVERNGCDPAMVKLTLPITAYISLDDLEYDLPSISEKTLFVDAEEKLSKSLSAFWNAAREYAIAKKDPRNGEPDHSPFGHYLQSIIGTPNVPMGPDNIDHIVYTPPEVTEDHIFPKEEAFLRLVLDNKQRGRKVLAFIGQIKARPATPRLEELMKRYGMKGVTMSSTTKDRRKFCEKAIAGGADVVFCSPEIVSTGINLEMFATIVWLSPNSNLFTVMQANRRIYRLNQELDCEIVYLGYNKMPEADRFKQIADKMQAAQLMRGDPVAGLGRLLGEEDLVVKIQDQILGLEKIDSDLSMDDLPPLERVEEKPKPRREVRRAPFEPAVENVQQLTLFA